MVINLTRLKNITIDKNVGTPVIRISCESCHIEDSVICYEEDVQDRDFHQNYYECDECKQVHCGACAEKELHCNSCDNDSFFRLKPLHVYVCGDCMSSGEKVCQTCRYTQLDKSVLFSD